MFKRKKFIIQILAAIMVCTLTLSAFTQGAGTSAAQNVADAIAQQKITKLDIDLDTGIEKYFNEDVVSKLPETVNDDQDISVIVTMSNETLTESYELSGSTLSLPEYVYSKEGKKVSRNIEKAGDKLLEKLKAAGVSYTLGNRYDTVISGFEVTIKAKDFYTVNSVLSPYADIMVGEEYAPSTYEVVTNEVDVYETGIFDSSSCEYQGDGVVVAVLDTGLDYTHTAFSAENFVTEKEAFTLDSISHSIKDTAAAGFTAGLTAEDVYVSSKVPFAYDYADKDPDVFPINSEHGTHVAGVIAGSDSTITGVAPNAQLAIMKVFSDTAQGAKDSWILAALEDCVKLGVDVINMSLGTACGFTREVDKEAKNQIYDKIRDEGISLICAASNDYNATFGSEKNGNLGLTSNPDSGTVGAPSTYESSLSVASVDGVKTPYLLHGDDVIYFNEATTSDAKKKDFVDAILKTVGEGVTSYVFDYEVIPGIGRLSDYPHGGDYYKGKIVLVKRGTTTFEDKVRIALKEKGAAGIIIYNNVSGTISMSVGADIGAVCSISQDEGEKLAAAGSGKLLISKDQVAGPFMSDFSSWGPTSDLKIKPEITAHGGEILSAVPGQDYDRLSGTSMAAPNQAGATALIRQYVKYSGVFGEPTNVEITSIVNQLMMSTTDIIYNKNGLPYAVRKQGSGLVNITKASTTPAYITTYNEDGTVMDKTKLELGDDRDREGVYEVTFSLNNVSSNAVSYKLGSIIMTEGVSETYTSHGATTVTQDGYLLSPTVPQIVSVTGNGSHSDDVITVNANGSVKITAKIVLSDADKKYLDGSFKYGMYVEGFITLDDLNGNDIDLSVPMLAFYGDWTEAPIFDEEFYDTNKDEINLGLDPEDKLMPDAYATRVIGGLYSDYISTLGEYYFDQNPSATQIAANKEHIAISNQENDSFPTCSIRSINAGFLRNVKDYYITVTDDATGRVVFETSGSNQYKSYNHGGTIYASSIDVDLYAMALNLKNNTKYTVELSAYIDYGKYEDQHNVRNTFTFPLYIDFEAPVITDVTYRTEYDKTSRKTKLFADLSIYDNHYAQAVQIGQIVEAEDDSEYTFSMKSFGKYITPVYSTFNATSLVTIELTDYVSQIKNSAGIDYATGTGEVVPHNNSFIATCYDYALNSAVYEIRLPDEIISMYFSQEELRLSPNETKNLAEIINVYPSDSWLQVLDFVSSDPTVVTVVNQTLIAKQGGSAVVEAIGYDRDGNKVSASIPVTVLKPGDQGYNGAYTIPAVNNFSLTGYKTDKAYYSTDPDDREIGFEGGTYSFDKAKTLSMYPSEAVTLEYILDSYFTDLTSVVFTSGDPTIATVDKDSGQIVAQAKGSTVIMAQVYYDGKPQMYLESVAVTVKDPFTTQGMYLMSYKGLGGTVEIPSDRGITTIYAYAFSGYEWVNKNLDEGDVIDEEDPYYIKQQRIGEDTITKVIIPEGVTQIDEYAFAKLTALEEVVLPSTLTRIGKGAFSECSNLTKINLQDVKFVNERAFEKTGLISVDFQKVVAIGNYAFLDSPLASLVLPKTAQSIGQGAFYDNKYLDSVEFKAAKIKVASYAFAGCSNLYQINVNATVISSYAFADCTALELVTLGKDVAVIGEFAFANTNISAFNIDSKNTVFTTSDDKGLIYSNGGKTLVLAAPMYKGPLNTITLPTECTEIATGAFSGNQLLFKLDAQGVTKIGSYGLAICSNLTEVKLGQITEVGDFAFTGTSLRATPDITKVREIGASAFSYTKIQSVNIGSDVVIGDSAFYKCNLLESVTLGDNVTVGMGAFYCPVELYTYESTGNFYTDFYTAYQYKVTDADGNVVQTSSYYKYDITKGITSILKSLTIGENANIGDFAFAGNAMLKKATIGAGASIGNYAFFNCIALTDIDLSKAVSIGDYAFSGSITQDYMLEDNEWQYAYEKLSIDGEIYILGYVYTGFAPAFTSLDLTSATEIGTGAFANNSSLSSVNFGNLTKISDLAFANCPMITEINLPDSVTEIGAQAFYRNKLTTVDLKNASTIGDYAFALNTLKTVTLADGSTVGNGAFAYNLELNTVDNLDKAVVIGDSAFISTALTFADLSSAEEIGEFAFANSALNGVVFGNALVSLGENPFYGCEISTFGKVGDVIFNEQVIGTELVETYDVSEKVLVIDGVLYQRLDKGLELVSYPTNKTDAVYTVEEGTVRIGANAFAGNSYLYSVTLSTTLKAIGDKAFYDCRGLGVVTFTSYYAPIFEEEYDVSVLTYNNLPMTGMLGEFEGLGISKYYMWNVTSNFNNFYYGANFVDYIGHVDANLVMVRPANGVNYNTFIHGQYFNATVLGANAATDYTVQVIEMINALPKNITLSNEAAVIAARNAYDKISSIEQKALVTNYSTLTDAEATIVYLNNRNNQETPIDPEPVNPDGDNGWILYLIVGLTVIYAAIVVFLVIKRKNKKNNG